MRAMARRNYQYFRYGTSNPLGSSLYASLQNGASWVMEQLRIGASNAKQGGVKAGDAVKEAGTTATHRAGEAKQRAEDAVREEL